MSRGFLQVTDADLLIWSRNFLAGVSADPGAVGLTPAQVAAYVPVHEAYAAAYTAAKNPITRTAGAVAAKNQKRAALQAAARGLVKFIEGTPGVTIEQKIDLGLTVRKHPTRIGRPEAAPGMQIESVSARRVSIRLYDNGAAGRRGRPAGVAGAAVLMYVGDEAPTNPLEWRFVGNTAARRMTFEVPLSIAPEPVVKVWVTAQWINPRMEAGPLAPPRFTYTQHGLSLAA